MYPQASLNSQDLFKETILPEQILIWSGIYNTCNMNKKSYTKCTYKTLPFEIFSESGDN